jgi:hypothetical protein
MTRILALQNLQAVGAETRIQDENSSCSYVGCGGCSSDSYSACKPAPVFIVTV